MSKRFFLYIDVPDDDEKAKTAYESIDKTLTLELQQGNVERWQWEVGE